MDMSPKLPFPASMLFSPQKRAGEPKREISKMKKAKFLRSSTRPSYKFTILSKSNFHNKGILNNSHLISYFFKIKIRSSVLFVRYKYLSIIEKINFYHSKKDTLSFEQVNRLNSLSILYLNNRRGNSLCF